MPVMTIDSLSGISGLAGRRRKRKTAKRKPAKRKKRGLRGAEATCTQIARVKRTRTVWVCPTGVNSKTASRTTKAKRCRKKSVPRTELVCVKYVSKGQPGYKAEAQLTNMHSRAKEASKRSVGRKVSFGRRKAR